MLLRLLLLILTNQILRRDLCLSLLRFLEWTIACSSSLLDLVPQIPSSSSSSSSSSRRRRDKKRG